MSLFPHNFLWFGASTATALVGGFVYATFVPTSGIWGRVTVRGSRAGPARVALTFDDGPTPGASERVLDALGEAGVKAAFFVIGRNVARCPEIVRRMHDEGHVVGNHTFDHDYLGVMRSGRYWKEQVHRTDDLIEQIIGRRPALFRPPMGIKTYRTARAARRHATVIWSRRALDGVPTTPARIVERLVPRAAAGDILLLHDGINPQSRRDPGPTIEAIRPLIQGLRERGLEPVRLDELTGLRAYLSG